MLPEPLHPAVVHFPIVLTFLFPLVALTVLWRIRRGAAPRPAWLLAVLTAVALTLSAWVAVQTGETDEEPVERIVAEAPLHTHEEAAERFLLLTGAAAFIATGGLLGGRTGSVARAFAAVAALGLMLAGWQVGHTGGELVYRYNAAAAHADGTTQAVQMGATEHDD